MGNVIENITGTRRLSKWLEKTQRAADSREQKLANLDAEIEALKLEEKAAVTETLLAQGADPEQSAYRMNSRAQQLREKRERLERSREGLTVESEVLATELHSAASQEAAVELQALTKDMDRLAEQERQLLIEAGGYLNEMARRWSRVASLRAQRSEMQTHVLAEQLRERSASFDPLAGQRWDAADANQFGPVSCDVAAFVEQLVEAAQDVANSGKLGQLVPDLSDAPRLPATAGRYLRKHERQPLRVNYRHPETGELLPAA